LEAISILTNFRRTRGESEEGLGKKGGGKRERQKERVAPKNRRGPFVSNGLFTTRVKWQNEINKDEKLQC
jgi:hypothetical protein